MGALVIVTVGVMVVAAVVVAICVALVDHQRRLVARSAARLARAADQPTGPAGIPPAAPSR